MYSAWWPDREQAGTTTWYQGRIVSVSVNAKEEHGYGPLRLYRIDIDDGNVLGGVKDN